jgi:Mn2+/Fe2+ NRAMP family transporter
VERKGTLWWVLFVVGALLGSGSSLSETDAQGFLKEDVVYQNAFGSAISRAFIVVSLFFGISYLRQVTKLAEKLENTQ